MTDNTWGVGDQKEAKAFDTIMLHGKKMDLIFGQYPHSRSYNNQYARDENGHIHDFDGHRRLIDIHIKSSNYLKESQYSGDQIRKAVNIEIFCDGEQVWEGFSRDPSHALLKANSALAELQEHSSNWLNKKDREALVGRKVFYREVPAVIKRILADQGCLIIETADGKPFPPPVYHDKYDIDEQETYVKVEVTSPHIWWFRD